MRPVSLVSGPRPVHPRHHQRGSVHAEHLATLVVVAIVGVVGLRSLGHGMHGSIASAAVGHTTASSAHAVVTSAQAAMWSDLATIGKATFEFWASPRTNPLGSWMVEPYRPILRATGMLPDTHLQNLRWLPGRGTADYSRWLSQIREGFVAEGGFPVVVLDTGRFMPKGLAAELRNNIGFPVPGVGTVRSPLAFADSYQDWVRTLINDAIGRQTPGGFITTPSPFSVPGAIPPYDRVPSTLVQDMRRGQELAPVPHIDDALAITASLTAEGTGTMYESRAHYLERAGAKRPPRAEDMAPASRNLGDIVLHSGSAFPGKGGGVYHRSPTSAEWTGQQRLVALSSVTTREQAAAARAQVMRMIRENIARQR